MNPALNPIDLEIIRHRLDAITVDAGETLVRVSGSQIAAEGSDYNVAIMAADGTIVACSKFIVVQTTALNLIVTELLQRYAENPGIHPGDQFLTNDPYLGSLHQPDVTLLAPIFDGERLVAWSGCTVHEADVGGPVGGGFNQAARSIFDEPPPIPPIKIVERGELRRDLEREYLARSRTPDLNALDLLGQIAANRACAERIGELVERYGVETVTGAMGEIVGRTEAAFRARLRALPDGVWRDVSYIEHERRVGEDYLPNQIYAVRCTVTKTGERLILDFSDSDEQAPGAVNCGYPALANFAMAAVLVQTCHGLAWAPGAVWRAVELRSKPGTVVHASWPAGVAMSSGTSAQAVRNVVSACLTRMLDASETFADRAIASSQSTGAGGMSISGHHADGRAFHTLFLDELTGGGGGFAGGDGSDTSGTSTSVGATPSNVETNEADFPVLYLARREMPDSAGPGRRRGGSGAIWSYRPHNAEGPIALLSMAQGLQHPTTLGAAGGEPGSASGFAVVAEPPAPPSAWAELGGDTLPLPGSGDCVRDGQVMVASSQGGGGFGDPIERPPEDVRRDVVEGLVSMEGARRDYAVVLSGVAWDATVDLAATERLRAERRCERLGGRQPRPRGRVRQGVRLSTHLDLVEEEGEGRVVCAGCGEAICARGAAIHENLLAREVSAGARFALTDRYPGSDRFRIRLFYCPGCGEQVDVQVARAGEPVLRTIDWPMAEA